MFELILAIFNYLGTFAFAISGARLIENKHQDSLIQAFFPAFLTAFGGGLTRDIVVLRRSPAILNSQDAVLVMLATYLVYAVITKTNRQRFFQNRQIATFLIVSDAIGVVAFIQCGCEAAFSSGASYPICLLCGMMTAIGGGILASIVSGRAITNIIRSSLGYRAIVLTHAILYILGHNSNQQELLVVGLAISCVFFCLVRENALQETTRTYRNISEINHVKYGRNIFAISRGKFFNMVKKLPIGGNEYKTFLIYGGKCKKLMFSYGG